MLQLGPTGIKKTEEEEEKKNECALQRDRRKKKIGYFGPFRRTVRDKRKKSMRQSILKIC
jgi:hypothetical protein